MALIAKEVRIVLVMVIVGAAALVALVQYTDICRLQAVTLNGQPVKNVAELGLSPNKPIVRQPLDSLADALLTRQGIMQVDIEYKLPNALHIRTNSLEPKCYLLDANTGAIYGLEETGRVVPVEYDKIDWDAPLFTGAKVKRLHERPADGRVAVMLSHLQRLRSMHEPLYRQIEEIDLSRPDFAMVTVAGKSYRLKVRPEEFADRYFEFDQFMARYGPQTDSVTNFDLTYADMIIRQGYVEPKEKPVIDTSEMNDKAVIIDESEESLHSADAQIMANAIAAERSTAKTSTTAGVNKGATKGGDKAKHANLQAKPGVKSGKVTTSSKSNKKSSIASSSSKGKKSSGNKSANSKSSNNKSSTNKNSGSKSSVNKKKTTTKPSAKPAPKKKSGSTPSKKTAKHG